MSDDENDWTMVDLGETDAEKRVNVKHHFWDSQNSCCVKRRNGSEIVVKAVGLAVELVYNAVVKWCIEVDVADVRI